MLTPLETEVLDLMLNNPGETYETLRRQLTHAVVSRRESTGVGFATHFNIPSDAEVNRGLPDMAIYNVAAESGELEHGASFTLFIRDGVLSVLEGVAVTGNWPNNTHDFRLYKLVSR
ncbi:MAG: hypothetical protein NTW19_22425 [Planctomycetota bacterium]|nr:hypothetical protein [Planctomycetota bacterium]